MSIYSQKTGKLTVNTSGDIPEMTTNKDGLPVWWEEVRTVINRQREDLAAELTPVTIAFESANTWKHTHNLGRFPLVQVLDGSGTVISPTVQHVSVTEINITHSGATEGSLILY